MKKYFLAAVFACVLISVMAVARTPIYGHRVEALDDSHWDSSQWISAADAPIVTDRVEDGSRAADGASWFVTTLTNPKPVTAVKWMTTGLGVYDLYVNGKLIGEEILKPGFTHYAKTKRSFTYDVTDAFDTKPQAENILAVEAVPGWWADKIITPAGHQGMIGSRPAFRGVIELTYSDGTKDYIGTNTTDWVAGIAGPVKHSAIFDGVEYDARIAPGYDTVRRLGTPEINTEFAGDILPSAGAEVYLRPDLALMPVEAYVWTDVTASSADDYGKVVVKRKYNDGDEMTLLPGETLVVDFGQNAAAVPSFDFKAAEGVTLRCLPGELVNTHNGSRARGMDGPEGSVHRLNLRIPETGMILDYTFAGDSDGEEFMPRTTFYGYRYVSVTADGPVTITSIASVPVTSIRKDMETGRITTGNDMVNKLIDNTVWGQRSNYLSVPTDCPQRNERLGWTADTQVFAKTGTFFGNTDSFFHKWMRDMRDTQHETGSFPGVAPIGQYGANPGDYCRLGWSDAGIIVPWVVWRQFGDTAIVDENWDAMEKYINHLNETKYDHNSLLGENANFQWADWLSYEPLESCGGGINMRDEAGNNVLRPEAVDYWNYLSACYWLSNALMMADMAQATGRDATRFVAMADTARGYITETFLNPDGTFRTEILNTMQTPALFALKNNIVTGAARENMIQRLRQNFADHGNCLQTGFLGTSILMPVLSENGMDDIAYELLLQRKNPSWGYSIDNGATTIWERWNSYTHDNGMGPQGMNSFNHYAYGCIGEWLWETVAGISTAADAPGFEKIVLRPVPDRRIGYVDAVYQSPHGKIASSWKYEPDGSLTWTFTIPEGTTAEVTLPVAGIAQSQPVADIAQSQPRSTKPGNQHTRRAGKQTHTFTPGTYTYRTH